jgi:transposase-like protein
MVGGTENERESMPKTRKSHPPSPKAKVAVEVIKAHKTAAQIAQMFSFHPTQVGGWKKQALAGLPDILANPLVTLLQQCELLGCRARPTTTSRDRRVRRIYAYSANSIGCI